VFEQRIALWRSARLPAFLGLHNFDSRSLAPGQVCKMIGRGARPASVVSAPRPRVFSSSIAKEAFNDPEWIFETKLDGYRAIAVIDEAGKARIWSRNHLPLEPKFPMVLEAVNQLKLRSTILDGEIVALDAEGIPRFQLLQQWQKRPTAPVVFYLFDLLWSDGRDITGKTVLQRRARLEEIIAPIPGIQVGGYVENRGKDLFGLAKEKGLEGIIAKRKASFYRPGKRSPDWLKIKSRPRQEFVVCGFTEGKVSRRHFGALLLGRTGMGSSVTSDIQGAALPKRD
jgi:bifunctional non-homologous end joining protein LigD